MKTILPILLLLTSCGSQGGEDDGAERSGNALPAVDQVADAGAADLAALQAKVERAMAVALPNVVGAEYRGLRPGAGGSACGEVVTAAGPGAGIARPFVVTPDGLAVVASGPAIAWEDPDDFVADAWIRWCATPEELQRLGPVLRAAAAASAPAPAPEAADPLLSPPTVEVPLPPAPPPEPDPAPPPPKAKAKAPPPPAQIDSFFNSVQKSE